MKKRFALCLFFVTTYISFSFAEDLPTGVFSMQECRECLIKFYRFEAIDEKLLASSAEKLEGLIFSFLNARSPSGTDTLFRARGTSYSEREGHLIPSGTDTLFRAYREVRSERIERFDPGVSRGSIRAYRGVRFGRIERFDPSVSRGSIRAYREVRFGRIERFDPSVSRGSIRAYRGVRSERAKNAHSIKRLMFKTFGVYILSMLTLFLPFMI